MFQDVRKHSTAHALDVGRLEQTLDGVTPELVTARLAGFDVVNLSLGTRSRDWALALYELCDRAYFQGTFVVTAANNRLSPSFPSLYSSVTSVACNLSRDPFRFHANPDPPTEFLARGIDVEVAWRGDSTSVVTGNSFAALHIAGLAALIRSKHPTLRPFQIKAALWATAANVIESTAPEFGGRLTQLRRRPTTSFTRAAPRQRQCPTVSFVQGSRRADCHHDGRASQDA